MDMARFFDCVRDGILGPTLSQDEVDGCEAILRAMVGCPIAYAAYALATAYKETAGTMRPINEFGGDRYFFRRYDPKGRNPKIARELGNTREGDGVKFHGRGYVQITGRRNYTKAQKELGVAFVANPELALDPDHAAAIMRRGMLEGWFTGKKLSTYLPSDRKASSAEFQQARRIINGTDCAVEIAGYATDFQKCLSSAGY